MFEAIHSRRRLGNREGGFGHAASTANARGDGAPARVLMHVLLVDDAQDTRDMYALCLKHLGVCVETAGDGFAALQAIADQPPDVIVLDLAMPATTGWDVIRELKRNRGTWAIPIVVVSGQEARDSAIDAGADSYLEKPCVPDVLFAEVMRVLRGTPATRSAVSSSAER